MVPELFTNGGSAHRRSEAQMGALRLALENRCILSPMR